ncbi:hypothetical protein [Amycolatopsis sp. WGS_07]|uniref:hypothetical protein n=1 Tax=Amycolatopsis sp. WGS_07 TaxID=3076764 RepID=UPI003872D534
MAASSTTWPGVFGAAPSVSLYPPSEAESQPCPERTAASASAGAPSRSSTVANDTSGTAWPTPCTAEIFATWSSGSTARSAYGTTWDSSSGSLKPADPPTTSGAADSRCGSAFSTIAVSNSPAHAISRPQPTKIATNDASDAAARYRRLDSASASVTRRELTAASSPARRGGPACWRPHRRSAPPSA